MLHGWLSPHRWYRASRPWRARLAVLLGAAAVFAMAAAGVLALSPAQPAWAAGRPVAAARTAAPRTDPGAATVAAPRLVARTAQAAPPPAQQGIRPDGVLGRWVAFGLLATLVVVWIALTAGVVRVFIGMGRRR